MFSLDVLYCYHHSFSLVGRAAYTMFGLFYILTVTVALDYCTAGNQQLIAYTAIIIHVYTLWLCINSAGKQLSTVSSASSLLLLLSSDEQPPAPTLGTCIYM